MTIEVINLNGQLIKQDISKPVEAPKAAPTGRGTKAIFLVD